MGDDDDPMGREDRRGLLLLAAEHGRIDAAEKALEHERKDPDGNVSTLLQATGPDDAAGNTAMHLACQGGHADFARVLLRRGANAGVLNAAGATCYQLISHRTPNPSLMHGVFEQELLNRALAGDASGVDVLLLAGVNPGSEHGGMRPAEWARTLGHEELALRLEAAERGELQIDVITENELEDNGAIAAGDDQPPGFELDGGSADPPLNGTTVTNGQRRLGWRCRAEPLPTLMLESSEVPPLFPLLWPQVSYVRGMASTGPPSCPSSPSNANVTSAKRCAVVALPLSAGSVIQVVPPFDWTVEEVAPILESLESAFVACASSVFLEAPLLVPRMMVMEVDTYNEDEAQNCSDTHAADIALVVDPRVVPPGQGFKISLDASVKGSVACISFLAGDRIGLRAAIGVFGQLLTMGAVDVVSKSLHLPSALVEDAQSQLNCFGGSREPPAVLLDVLGLADVSASEAFDSFARWRTGRVYAFFHSSAWQHNSRPYASKAQLLRRIFDLRRRAASSGIDIVPVLNVDATTPLADPSSRKALVELLAQFGSATSIGLRCTASQVNSTVSPEQLFARASELASVASVAFGPTPVALCVWMRADDGFLIDRFGRAARAARTPGILSRARVVFEGDASDFDAATAELNLYGVPSSWLISCIDDEHLPEAVFDDNEDDGEGEQRIPPLPAVVWPGAGIQVRAQRLHDILQRAWVSGARGAIVEVPLWRSPWILPQRGHCSSTCGGQEPQIASPSFCSVTGFLASGLTGTSSSLPAVLCKRNQLAKGGDDVRGSLGALLAVQLLGAPPSSQGGGGGVTAAALAEVLWGASHQCQLPPAPSPSASPRTSPSPPPTAEELKPLLEILAGRWRLPRQDRAEANIAIVAGWHHHLHRRRQLVRSTASDVVLNFAGSRSRWMDCAWSLLQIAQVGLEWLVLGCQICLALLRQEATSSQPRTAPTNSRHRLRAAIDSLSPAKLCDIQNKFLKVVEFTLSHGVSRVGDGSNAPNGNIAVLGECEDGQFDEAVVREFKAIWNSGLCLGAALGLEPWLSFDAARKSSCDDTSSGIDLASGSKRAGALAG